MRFSDGWTLGNVYIRIRPPFPSPPLPSFRVHSTVYLIDCAIIRMDNDSSVRGRGEGRFFFFFCNFLETRNFDMFIRLFVTVVFFFLCNQCNIGREEKQGERRRGGRIYLRKNHVDFESFKIIIRWNDIFFIGTFFELLKFMERIFFFFSKNTLFFRYLIILLENPARYFRRTRTRSAAKCEMD